MNIRVPVRLCLALLLAATPPSLAVAAEPVQQSATPGPGAVPLKAFLDCQRCFQEFLRAEVTFVDYVRERSEADVHVLISTVETGSGGREYTMAFIGLQALAGREHTLRTVTASTDSDDTIRRQLANALRLGLLTQVAAERVPSHLGISVELEPSGSAPTRQHDKWNHWVFSVRGAASFEGEESSRQTQLGASVSADRITPTWKVTLGADVDHETEEFDLDEDDPVKVSRRERDLDWLVARALGEHWSVGGIGEVSSSTFDNITLSVAAAPAVEYNVFPYSAYTRRQLRALYAIGLEGRRYREPTLFGKTSETLPTHALSLTFEQRERWGSLEARTEWSQFLHDPDKSRFEVDAEVALRVTRGLSVGMELSASRIRDQLSLPARGASPEEVLLRIRRLRTGYEYNVGVSVTYAFGSIFSSVINPRFGR